MGFYKNPLSAESQSEQLEYAGMLVGTVKAIEGNEIIITGSNIGKNVMLFDKLCVFSDEEMIILSAHFPMMTVAKCKISSGDISLIKPGMKVTNTKKKSKKRWSDITTLFAFKKFLIYCAKVKKFFKTFH
jgi:hypothetical protein